MKEEILKNLGIIIEYLTEILLKTGEFTMEQAPLLIQEFYLWSFWSHVYFLIIGIILLVSAYLLHHFSKKENEYGKSLYYRSDNLVVVPVALSSFIGIVMFLDNIYNLIYISVAPRLYLLEYIRELL